MYNLGSRTRMIPPFPLPVKPKTPYFPIRSKLLIFKSITLRPLIRTLREKIPFLSGR